MYNPEKNIPRTIHFSMAIVCVSDFSTKDRYGLMLEKDIVPAYERVVSCGTR